MQKGQRIYKDCKTCFGTGKMYDRSNYDYLDSSVVTTIPPSTYVEVDCPDCEGGIRPWGWLRDEKEDTMPGEEA